MKKKILIPMLCLIATLSLALGFSACGETTGNSGATQQTTEENKKPGGEEQKPGEGRPDEDEEKDPEEKDPEEEDPEEGKEEEPQGPEKSSGTQGLTYAPSPDGSSYVCTGAGTASGSSLEVASWYENKWVTGIGEKAFENCTALGITIPDSVTGVGAEAFAGSRLTNLTVGSGVTSIGEDAFLNCYNLIYISVSEQNAAYASQDGILYNKAKTQFVHIPRSIGGTVTIPGSVAEIGEKAFAYHNTFTGISISEGVTRIGKSAFENCYMLATVALPEGISCIEEKTFYNCSSLKSINLPSSLTKIGEDAFFNCYTLESIEIPDGVTEIGSAFGACQALATITLPDSLTKIDSGAFVGTAYYEDEENWYGNVLYLGNHLIKAQESITGNYAIANGTLTLAIGAFYGCSDLTALSIPASVTHIGGSNGYCTSLTGITVDPNNAAYADHEGILYDKAKTQILLVPLAISGSVTVPDSITEIPDQAFSGCRALESITLGSGVASIGDGAFSDCRALESIVNLEGVTSIGDEAFSNCYALESIVIPEGVTSIGDEAFYMCRALKNVTIRGSVTSIGSRAFSDCYELANITLPKTVTVIGDRAFSSCLVLWNFYFEGTTEEWNAVEKGENWKYKVGVLTVYCSDGTVRED